MDINSLEPVTLGPAMGEGGDRAPHIEGRDIKTLAAQAGD